MLFVVNLAVILLLDVAAVCLTGVTEVRVDGNGGELALGTISILAIRIVGIVLVGIVLIGVVLVGVVLSVLPILIVSVVLVGVVLPVLSVFVLKIQNLSRIVRNRRGSGYQI